MSYPVTLLYPKQPTLPILVEISHPQSAQWQGLGRALEGRAPAPDVPRAFWDVASAVTGAGVLRTHLWVGPDPRASGGAWRFAPWRVEAVELEHAESQGVLMLSRARIDAYTVTQLHAPWAEKYRTIFDAAGEVWLPALITTEEL